MLEIKQSAQTLPPLNVGGQAHRQWRSLQELVVESLVVSLAMVVVDVLAHEETQVPGGARRATIITRHDNARADYRVGDKVTFTSPDGPRRGEIVKFNPKSAKVRCEETGWNVSYGLLHRAGRESARNGAERLNGVAGMARRLMDEQGLTGWTLAFGEARKRLGACHFRHHVIWISRTHALEGSEEQIRDTVLHEIAHAIAGHEAGHGPLWKATARRIGATPRAKTYENQTS